MCFTRGILGETSCIILHGRSDWRSYQRRAVSGGVLAVATVFVTSCRRRSKSCRGLTCLLGYFLLFPAEPQILSKSTSSHQMVRCQPRWDVKRASKNKRTFNCRLVLTLEIVFHTPMTQPFPTLLGTAFQLVSENRWVGDRSAAGASPKSSLQPNAGI